MFIKVSFDFKGKATKKKDIIADIPLLCLGHALIAAESPVSEPKLPRHVTHKCGWICHTCRNVHRFESKLHEMPCVEGNRGHTRVEEVGWFCSKCPCVSNDITTFLKAPCHEELVKKRKAEIQTLQDSVRAQAKELEKLKILKMLEDERKKLHQTLTLKALKHQGNLAV